MSGAVRELDRALRAGDAAAVRRLSREALESGEPTVLDEALAVLATHASTHPDDPVATEVLVETLDASGVIRRFAGAALLDRSAVDDVAQDALISVAASIGGYSGRGKVTTWVHSIVRRRVVDHLRRQRATVPLEEDAGPAERMSSVIATRATVQQAVAALPVLYREPVVLRDMEGHPYAEVATRLGRPLGTVKAQVSRGRALVAAALRGIPGDGPTAEQEEGPA